jgi:hypothetical protein
VRWGPKAKGLFIHERPRGCLGWGSSAFFICLDVVRKVAMGLQKTGHHSGSRPLHLGTLFCLFVFLPYFFLPLLYYAHLTQFSLPVESRDPRAGPPIAVSPPAKSPQPFHDSSSCPICRVAQTFEDGGLLLSCPKAERPVMAGIFSESHFSDFADPETIAHKNRGPPISPPNPGNLPTLPFSG